MLKTSPERRAIVARSRAKHPRKTSATYAREWHRKNAHKVNEKKRAKRARNNERERVNVTAMHERLGPLSIISGPSMAADRTHWKGPGWFREVNLERQADRFILKAERKKRAQHLRPGNR